MTLLISFLIAGGACLVFGAHLLVTASVRIARRAGLSPFFIGATLVAFGTSVPELAASIYAVSTGQEAIALGNVLGSNIANLALVLGAVALFQPIPVRGPNIKRDLFLVVLITLVPLLALPFDDTLHFWHGVLLILLLVGYLWRSCKHNKSDEYEPLEISGTWSPWLIGLSVIAGPLLLWAGSWLFVESAATIGRAAGLSEPVIGLTIVAFTTSLPELVTSVYAAIRGYAEIGIGNILGSCVMNVLAVLGISLLFGNIAVDPQIYWIDLPALLIVSLVCVPVLLTARRVSRGEGGLLFTMYLVYIGILLFFAPTWFPAEAAGTP